MSQHRFLTQTPDGQDVSVLAGWDRPLQGFFMVVERVAPEPPADAAAQAADTDDEASHFVYSNLDDPEIAGRFGLSAKLDFFRRKAAGLGLAVPESMWTQIERDSARNVGNRYVWYAPDGSITQEA